MDPEPPEDISLLFSPPHPSPFVLPPASSPSLPSFSPAAACLCSAAPVPGSVRGLMASPTSTNPAHAHFESFLQAQLCQDVLSSFQGLCGALGIEPGGGLPQYHKIKAQLNYWSAKSLWAKLDKRAGQPDYQQGRACASTKVDMRCQGRGLDNWGRGGQRREMGCHARTALCVHSAWWWARDLVGCGLLWSWHCWGPVWCWWKSAPSSLATMCSTSGPSPSMT